MAMKMYTTDVRGREHHGRAGMGFGKYFNYKSYYIESVKNY